MFIVDPYSMFVYFDHLFDKLMPMRFRHDCMEYYDQL